MKVLCNSLLRHCVTTIYCSEAGCDTANVTDYPSCCTQHVCVRNIRIVFCVERLVLAVYLWLTGVCLPTQTDKRPENVYHSYEDAFNPDTASTLEYRLKEDDGKDATVIANVHGAGDDEDVVVSGAHVDVRKEKALVLENIYMSEDELDEAEPAPAGMEGMVRMCVVCVCLFMCVCDQSGTLLLFLAMSFFAGVRTDVFPTSAFTSPSIHAKYVRYCLLAVNGS